MPYVAQLTFSADSLVASTPRISPFYAFEQSDSFGRLVVVLLFFASILAWSIMAEKWQTLRRVNKECRSFRAAFEKQRIAEFLCNYESMKGPMAGCTSACVKALAEIFQTTPDDLRAELAKDGIPKLTEADFHRLQAATEGRVDAELMDLEQRLGLLSSIVSASPFLGLLGTVWGVMMAFTGMAVEGRADIKAIAPGVSGALLTTVVGLLVAIPAVIGYNILVTQVKRVTVDLDNYAEGLLSAIKVASCRDGGK